MCMRVCGVLGVSGKFVMLDILRGAMVLIAEFMYKN